MLHTEDLRTNLHCICHSHVSFKAFPGSAQCVLLEVVVTELLSVRHQIAIEFERLHSCRHNPEHTLAASPSVLQSTVKHAS